MDFNFFSHVHLFAAKWTCVPVIDFGANLSIAFVLVSHYTVDSLHPLVSYEKAFCSFYLFVCFEVFQLGSLRILVFFDTSNIFFFLSLSWTYQLCSTSQQEIDLLKVFLHCMHFVNFCFMDLFVMKIYGI